MSIFDPDTSAVAATATIVDLLRLGRRAEAVVVVSAAFLKLGYVDAILAEIGVTKQLERMILTSPRPAPAESVTAWLTPRW